MQCILYKIYLFFEGFPYVRQIDMQPICTPTLAKFYSCKKWVLQVARGRGHTQVAMRAAAPVGGAQGLSGGALRGTSVGEVAALDGQGSGGEGAEVRHERKKKKGGAPSAVRSS
jgi:hypothetical protein